MSFPITDKSPVAHPGPLPAETDVAIIGGGVIGVMTAWHLAGAGLRVTLLEKGRIAAEQSSRNWGWIRQQGRDAAELPLMIEANRLWRDLAPRLDTDIGLAQQGVLYLAEDEHRLSEYAAWLPLAKAHDLDTRLLDEAGVARLLPQAARRWKGSLWTPSDMRAEPWLAVPALARAAAARGVTIVERCAARLIDTAAGRVTGVITEQGLLRCPEVVVAGGAWSALFLRRHGIAIPQLAVRATVAATLPLPEVFAGNASDADIAFRRRADGGYSLAPGGFHEFLIGPDALRAFSFFRPHLRDTLRGTRLLPAAPRCYPDAWTTPRRWDADRPSPFEAMRILDPRPHGPTVAALARAFAARFPGLGTVPLRLSWAGMIDTMPDVVPVISCADTLPGLTIATGMSGHGFGIGPAVGRVTAALVTGQAPGHDLARFRLSRFSDGSPMIPGPGL
jgi:glycine/D-amino acid oxidase-like deaminating enzyme